MRCRVEVIEHESRVLKENPLEDPFVRELGIILPPSYDEKKSARYPVIVLLTGYTGTGLQHLNQIGFVDPMDRRLARLVAEKKAEEVILILPNCFTRYGGSQYIDSPAVGRYETYVTEELIPFVDQRYRTIPSREARAVIGKSSGGYGAMIHAMHRPDVYGAFGSHAGDAAFDIGYWPEFPAGLLRIEAHGGIRGFLEWFDGLPAKPDDVCDTLSHILGSACWSPSPTGPYAYGQGFELPYDPYTCARIDRVWAKWLAWDPVQMIDQPKYLEAWRSMRAIYLDGGLTDEYNLQLAARQISRKLKTANVPHVHEEFEGGHFNVYFRYDRSLEVITKALARPES
jgi:enterochelin esterase family protein